MLEDAWWKFLCMKPNALEACESFRTKKPFSLEIRNKNVTQINF